jgi:octaprenyl-diphosphate synthase
MPTTAQPAATIAPTDTSELLKALYAPIAAELGQVEALLKTELRSEFPFVDELVRYGCLLGGKRLRPALLLLTAKSLGGRVKREHITLATVVEMIHTATLVHDDVLDEAEMRRHLATVNARWDNEASVLLGDFLFTHAFYLASTLDSVLGCRLIGRATNIVCEGELRQKGSRGNFELSEDEYLEIVAAKTAALTAVSCRLGALFAGADEATVEQMDGFGRDLGIAFQIADDLLDVLGDERTTGKSLGTDLEKQKPTLPVIRALELAKGNDRQAILDLVSGDDRRPVLLGPYLERYGAVEYTRKRATSFAHHARRRLESLTPGPSRDVLAAMTEFVVSRSM